MSEQDEGLVSEVEAKLEERDEAAQAAWQAERDAEVEQQRAAESRRLAYNEAVNYAVGHASIDPETGEKAVTLPAQPEE